MEKNEQKMKKEKSVVERVVQYGLDAIAYFILISSIFNLTKLYTMLYSKEV
jgi:hypothetical protein